MISQPPKPEDGLDEFKKLVNDYQTVTGYVVKGAVALPLADYVTKLGPFWPNADAVPVITALVELLTLIWVFQFWLPLNEVRLRRAFGLSVVFACVLFLSYAIFFEAYTYIPPNSSTSLYKGLCMRPEVKAVIGPQDTPDSLIHEANDNPAKVYEYWSIILVAVIALCLWLLSFSCFVAAISSFILYQKRRKPT